MGNCCRPTSDNLTEIIMNVNRTTDENQNQNKRADTKQETEQDSARI